METTFSLSQEDEQLLIEILLSQQYALELVSCEISDIENGFKYLEQSKFEHIKKLYDHLSSI